MECENNTEVKNINEDTKRENELVFKLEEIEETIESDDTKRSECESGSDVPQQTQPNELCPVSWDEHALSAICALCAARLREARAFSAQARAAEEHFTSLYKQNRVRALVNEVVIKKDVDVPEKVNEVDDLDIGVPDTANSDVDSPEVSIEAFRIERTFEWAPKLNKDIQVRCYKPASKKSPANNITNEYTQKILSEGVPQGSKEILRKARCYKPAPKNFIFHLSPSDYQRVGKSFKCTRCDKLFCKREGIHNHVKNMHLELPEYTLKCLRCDKTFNKLSDFNRHKKHDHSIITKKNIEEKSRKVYALSPSDFERVGDAYKCNRCEKQYKNFEYVRKHVMHLHLKWPRYTCSHCDKRFLYRAPFTKHKLEEHSIDDRKKCNACEATFNTSYQLDVHRNNFHMLGMQQTCPDCEYFCFSEKSMRRHVVKHSTVREHHCKYCKKSFLRKTNLTQHEKIHTGDKRKVCNVCGQAFVQRASLKYHLEKHHPEVRL